MPELPDLTIYIEALERSVGGRQLEQLRIASPFVLRSVEPPPAAAEGRRVERIGRIGKRIVFELEGELFLVIHLMIAGRFRWRERGKAVPRRLGLAGFDFETGTLLLIEASQQKRSSLHVVAGREALADFDPGGLEVMGCELDEFRAAVAAENHTLKRTLTDPRLLAGIGNAYSDEILHHARLSPMKLSSRLSAAEIERLHSSTQQVLELWIERLRVEVGDGFPEKVTAFREEMAVHGRYKLPCPDCGAPIQRIRYADNECNYCARCQNEGRLLADRGLSRLLKQDWPRTLEELERRASGG